MARRTYSGDTSLVKASRYRSGFLVIVLANVLVIFSARWRASSQPSFVDLQNDGSQFYGVPLITIGAIPFGVNTPAILRQFEVSIGSWLRASAQIVVHLYDVVGGMGNLSSILIENLQREFGPSRIFIAGKIVKQYKIETIPEAFSAVEAGTKTIFSAWFSNDMILPTNWMDYVFATIRYFREYNNYSMHFPRQALHVSCRDEIWLDNITSGNWPQFSANFFQKCRRKVQSIGYDCYLWNHLGINMTASGLLPFYIGRPFFDGAIIWKQMQQGWFVSVYPALMTYHLEHPDRLQYAKVVMHPDSQYNLNLSRKEGGHQWWNNQFTLRMNLTHVLEKKRGKWVAYPVERPIGVFPLSEHLV